MWRITIIIIFGVLAACSPVTPEILDSERAQDGMWAMVQTELAVAVPTPENVAKWQTAIPAIRLENRRRAAALAEEPFDMKKNMDELGIKPNK